MFQSEDWSIQRRDGSLNPMMRRFFAQLTLVCALMFQVAPVSGQDAVPESAKSLAGEIHTVLYGGYWSNGGDEGFFRAVVIAEGVEHVNHSLYLQWVKVDIEQQSYVLSSSVSIEEINTGHAENYVLELTREESVFGTLRMTVVVTRVRSGGEIKYRLTANGAEGAYKITRIN